MAKLNSIGQDLYDFLATKNFDITTLDQRGQPSQPEDARVFKFDWITTDNTNYGTAVITLTDEDELILFFGDNIGRGMDDKQHKDEWYDFMLALKNFATRHDFHNFQSQNINRLKHTMTGLAAIKEGLFEGYYGNRHTSYMGEATQARLVIKHNRMIGENDKRYRFVESLFIETALGERFKLPFRNLTGGRAMLEHVRQGGKPYDPRGQHINGLVEEITVLSRFNRASTSKIFEGDTADLVKHARVYYESLRQGLKKLGGTKGYNSYFEQWSPDQFTDSEQLVEQIKNMFIEQTLDQRIEQALPTLAKIKHQGDTKMKEIEIFETWIDRISEGTWALPDTPEENAKLQELMGKELIVGPDAVNATEQLYNLVGDDELFDRLYELAKKTNGRANIWEDSEIQQRLADLGIQMPDAAPAPMGQVPPVPTTQQTGAPDGAQIQPQAPAAPVTEARLIDESGETMEHILDRFPAEVKQFENSGELDSDLYDALYDYYFKHGDMPYAVAKGKTGDPRQWITDRLRTHFDIKEADNLSTFETMDAITGHGIASEGQCNMTHEGQYCPRHGLRECGAYESADDPMNYNAAITGSYYEDQKTDDLARLKYLALAK